MRRAVIIMLLLSLTIVLCGCGHEHTWKDATCTEPRTCSECGATEGEALGHEWKDATCTKPKSCSRCGETQGSALGHVEGKWKTVNEATLSKNGKEEQLCSVCGEVIDSHIIKKNIEYSGGEFNFTMQEFIDFLNTQINKSSFSIYDHNDEAPMNLGHNYGVYYYDESKNAAIISLPTNSNKNVTEINVWGETESFAMAVCILQWMTGRGAEQLDLEPIMNAMDRGGYTLDGLKMTFTSLEGTYMLFTITGS